MSSFAQTMTIICAVGTSAGLAATFTMRPSRPSIARTASLQERKQVVAFMRSRWSHTPRSVDSIGPMATPPAT